MKKPKRTFKQNRIFTQNNPLSPRICPELAAEIGLDKSILLLQYEFWIATEGEEREGQLWIRKTVREIKKVFLFWSTSTINRIINKLINDGYMVADALDNGDQKNGRWLRFGFDGLGTLSSIKIICAETGQMFVPKEDGICANLRQTASQDETNNGSSPYIDTKSDQEYKSEAPSFLDKLRADPLFAHVDFDLQLGLMRFWLDRHKGRRLTEGFVLNWLGKIERPVTLPVNGNSHKRDSAFHAKQTELARKLGREYRPDAE